MNFKNFLKLQISKAGIILNYFSPHTQTIQLQWNKFKVTYRNLPNFYPNNGYFFTNTLDIETESLSLNYINPTNQNRLNVIMKLHNKGWSNKEIVTFLNLNGIQRRNKKDNYTMKDVWVCISKLKKREQRKHNTQFKLGDWELWK